MKRYLWILLLLTAFLLAACGPASGPSGIAPILDTDAEATEETEETLDPATAPNTEPVTEPTTAPTTEPTTAPTTAPTEPSAEPTIPPTQLTEEELFQNLIRDEYWYYRALGCTFEKPEEISLQHYFYGGMPNGAYHENTFTPEEQAAVDAAYKEKYGKDPYTGATKLPVTEIEKALSVLGLTLENVNIPADWIYYEATDSYYFWRSDAYGVVSWKVTEVVKDDDGIVKISWETDQIHYNTATGEFWSNGVQMVMTLRENEDGTYLILSNSPAK